MDGFVVPLCSDDVLGDGSCFFRSVYRSASRSMPVLRRLVAALPRGEGGTCADSVLPLGLDSLDGEDAFVRCARDALSSYMALSRTYRVAYDHMSAVRAENEENWSQVSESLSRQVVDAFNGAYGRPDGLATFVSQCARHVLDKTAWVTELETQAFGELLQKSTGLAVDVTSASTPGRAKIALDEKFPPSRIDKWANTIAVVCINETHYEFARFVPYDEFTALRSGMSSRLDHLTFEDCHARATSNGSVSAVDQSDCLRHLRNRIFDADRPADLDMLKEEIDDIVNIGRGGGGISVGRWTGRAGARKHATTALLASTALALAAAAAFAGRR